MRTLLTLLLFAIASPSVALADPPPPTVDALSRSIFRAKTGPRGDMRWRECNRNIRGAEAATRAREYAGYLVEEYEADPDFDPWIAAAIMAQESSFNRCAVSRGAWRAIRDNFPTEFGRQVTESDLRRILRYSRLRSRLGVRRFDAGLAQFRWPGTMARRAGLTDAAQLINAQHNIHLLAESMKTYRRVCSRVNRFTGMHTTRPRSSDGRVRVLRYNVACSEGYWVHHNTGGSWFNYRYYHNVKRWHGRLTSEFATSTTIEEHNGS